MTVQTALSLSGVSAHYGQTRVLDNLSLDIAEGELVSLLGSSGCGKTTTLRVIAGFQDASAGTVRLKGRDLLALPTHKRDIGLVFQSYALLPHLSVRDNVAYGLTERGMGRAERNRRAGEFLEMVGLSHQADRLPAALSGGQRQRVALARALVIDPALMMFDEPLSNLDAKLRLKMRVEIRRLQLESRRPTVYVTHDQEEAFAISDRVAIMNAGRIVQCDSPEVLYNRPANRFVAEFVGFENILPYDGVETGPQGRALRLKGGDLLPLPHGAFPDLPARGLLAARPEALVPGNGDGLAVRIGVRTYLGRAYEYVCDSAAGPLIARGDAIAAPMAPEAAARLTLDPAYAAILPADDQQEAAA